MSDLASSIQTAAEAAMNAALVQPDDDVREWAEEAREGGYSHVSIVRPETILALLARAALASEPPATGLDAAVGPTAFSKPIWQEARQIVAGVPNDADNPDGEMAVSEYRDRVLRALAARLSGAAEPTRPDPEFLERPCPACGAALAPADTHWSLVTDAYECPAPK